MKCKKIILLLSSAALMFTLTGCESREERKIRQLEEAADQLRAEAEQSQKEYEDLVESVERIKALQDALANAK